jgi:hypothetical protein
LSRLMVSWDFFFMFARMTATGKSRANSLPFSLNALMTLPCFYKMLKNMEACTYTHDVELSTV